MNTMETLLTAMQAQFAKSVEQVRTEATRMDEAAQAATGGKIAAITPCVLPTSIARCASISSFSPNHSGSYASSWAVCARNARAVLKTAREELEALHASNLPLLESNQRVSARVKLIMGNLGIPESRSTYSYATKSARKMTRQTVVAGYIADLAAVCKTDDGYSSCMKALDDFERRIEHYEETERRKADDLERERGKERAQREQLTLLGALAHKYACAAELDEVIDAMAAEDKYFGLGYWLERNRTDWNDGPSFARNGLRGFSVETDEDRAIYADISRHIEDWDGDGRAFQNIEFGFGALFAKADAEVMLDYSKLKAVGLIPGN